jgi:hypothetical protein
MIWIVNIKLMVFATWQTDMNAVFKGIMKRDTGQEIERCVAKYFWSPALRVYDAERQVCEQMLNAN